MNNIQNEEEEESKESGEDFRNKRKIKIILLKNINSQKHLLSHFPRFSSNEANSKLFA